MMRDEFKQKILEMFKQLDEHEDTEMYLQLVMFENNIPVDIEIATNGCTVCHRNALELFIKQENIQHTSSNRQQVH